MARGTKSSKVRRYSKKVKPSKPVFDFNSMDLHYWVVNKDGTIYDPHFVEYDMIKFVRQTTNTQKYQPFPDDIRDKLFKIHVLTHIQPALKEVLESGGDLDDFTKNWKPQFGQCILNAFCYNATHEGSKLVVGKMGWKKSNGDVFWEYG